MNIPRWGFSYDGWVDVQNLLQLSSELRTHLGRVALDQEVHQQQGQEGHSTDFFKTKNPFHSKSLRSTSNTSNTFHCTRGHSGNKIWQFYICQLSNFYTVGIAVHAIDLLQKIILIFHLQLVICCCWCNYIHIWEWLGGWVFFFTIQLQDCLCTQSTSVNKQILFGEAFLCTAFHSMLV